MSKKSHEPHTRRTRDAHKALVQRNARGPGEPHRRGLEISKHDLQIVCGKMWKANSGAAELKNLIPNLARRAPLFEGGGGSLRAFRRAELLSR